MSANIRVTLAPEELRLLITAAKTASSNAEWHVQQMALDSATKRLQAAYERWHANA